MTLTIALFLDSYGNTAVTGICDGGYYCPAGMNMSDPTEYTCPQGQSTLTM